MLQSVVLDRLPLNRRGSVHLFLIEIELYKIKIDLKEIDRLHYHVRAIENDCHIVPKGSVKLNSKHEVQRNEAYIGLPAEENFDIRYFSHFRNSGGNRISNTPLNNRHVMMIFWHFVVLS